MLLWDVKVLYLLSIFSRVGSDDFDIGATGAASGSSLADQAEDPSTSLSGWLLRSVVRCVFLYSAEMA